MYTDFETLCAAWHRRQGSQSANLLVYLRADSLLTEQHIVENGIICKAAFQRQGEGRTCVLSPNPWASSQGCSMPF